MSHYLSSAAYAVMIAASSQNIAYAEEWGIGAGVASVQSPYKNVDVDNTAVPYLYYEGERFSASFDSMSYSFVKGDSFELSVLGKVRYMGYEAKDSSTLTGMKKRDNSIDLGMSAGVGGNWGILSISAVSDVSDRHEGEEVEVTYLAPFGDDVWSVTPYIGARWQSKELVDYYYGVRKNEARLGRPQFAGEDTVNTFIGIDTTYRLSQNWQLASGLDYTRLGDEIKNSPIVSRDYQSIGYVALSYLF